MKHQTYIKYFNDLVDWGFFNLIEKSKNQYSSNIISLVYAMPKKDKALDKAMVKHVAKQGTSTGQSKVHIDKQETINQETINKVSVPPPFQSQRFIEIWDMLLKSPKQKKKPITAIQLIAKQLLQFDEPFAYELVENAISSNYQGVVFPDSKEKFLKSRNGSGNVPEPPSKIGQLLEVGERVWANLQKERAQENG